ncbi:MAG: cupredoxin domain-containing protein [Chloroflexi bacterium]|nr:cupredoxin domain-containing protein [Chloroflexota bacterium]
MNKLIAIGAFLSLVAIVAIGCGSAEVNREDGAGANAIEVTQAEDSALPPLTSDDGHDEAVSVHDEEDDGHGEAVAVHDDALDVDDGDVFEITLNVIEGRNWGFDPEVIEVFVGQRVKLTLVNDGRAEHDVEISGLMADHIEREGSVAHSDRLGGGGHESDVVAAHAVAGTTSSVIFTPTEAGVYEFTCTLPGHKEAGMVGKLIVTDLTSRNLR